MTTPEQARKLAKELLEACNGHPHAKIPWPHRKLHDAAQALEDLADQMSDLQHDNSKMMESFVGEINDMAAQVETWRNKCGEAQNEVDDLSVKIDETS